MSNSKEEQKVAEYAVNCTRYVRVFKVAPDTTIYKGTMVCLNDSSLAVPADNKVGLTHVVGIAAQTARSDESISVQTGFFAMSNDPSNKVTNKNIDKSIYIKDACTVSNAAGAGQIIAGKMRFIDTLTQQIVVEVGNI